MSFKTKRHENGEAAQERIRRAEAAGEEVDRIRSKVQPQLGLVARLTEGWREVHQRNHLAELFTEDYGGIRG